MNGNHFLIFYGYKAYNNKNPFIPIQFKEARRKKEIKEKSKYHSDLQMGMSLKKGEKLIEL